MSHPQQNRIGNGGDDPVGRALRELLDDGRQADDHFEHRFFERLYALARARNGYWGEIQLPEDELKRIASMARLFTRLDLDHEKVKGQPCPDCLLPYLGQDTANCKDLENAEPGKSPEGSPLCVPVMLPCPGGHKHPRGDACLQAWLEGPFESKTCPGCRHDFTQELSVRSNGPPFLNGATDDFLLLFNLAVDRRIVTLRAQGSLPPPQVDPFRNDPFTLGLTIPGPRSSGVMIEPILRHANTHYAVPGHPFTQLASYEIRGQYRNGIGEELCNELYRGVLREREALGYGHAVFRREVRSHLEVVEVYPAIPHVPPQLSSAEQLQVLTLETRRQVSEMVEADPTTLNVRHDFFQNRQDAIRAYILAARQNYITPANYICVLREVQISNPFGGTLLFTVWEEASEEPDTISGLGDRSQEESSGSESYSDFYVDPDEDYRTSSSSSSSNNSIAASPRLRQAAPRQALNSIFFYTYDPDEPRPPIPEDLQSPRGHRRNNSWVPGDDSALPTRQLTPPRSPPREGILRRVSDLIRRRTNSPPGPPRPSPEQLRETAHDLVHGPRRSALPAQSQEEAEQAGGDGNWQGSGIARSGLNRRRERPRASTVGRDERQEPENEENTPEDMTGINRWSSRRPNPRDQQESGSGTR